jgi:hypothetical protein
MFAEPYVPRINKIEIFSAADDRPRQLHSKDSPQTGRSSSRKRMHSTSNLVPRPFVKRLHGGLKALKRLDMVSLTV